MANRTFSILAIPFFVGLVVSNLTLNSNEREDQPQKLTYDENHVVTFSKKRLISTDEYHFALKLFPRQFPKQGDIYITNGDCMGNPCVVPDGIEDVYVNMKDHYENPLANPSLFAHELTHVWQYEHFGRAWYLREFLGNHVFCSGDPYDVKCDENKKFAFYNAEQQGTLVEMYYESDPCATKVVEKAVGTDTWRLMIGSNGRDITVSEKGELYLTNTKGSIYNYDGRKWNKLSGSSGSSIAANSGKLFLINTKGSIYQRSGENWTKLSGSNGRDIAVNSNGEVWLVNTKGTIYKRSGSDWKKMPGSNGARIAAGAGQVWLVNTGGKIYKYDAARSKWNQMPGSKGRDITISNKGKVFLTNKDGKIYQFNGKGWTQLDGSSGKNLAANRGKLVLLNTKGRIYERDF